MTVSITAISVWRVAPSGNVTYRVAYNGLHLAYPTLKRSQAAGGNVRTIIQHQLDNLDSTPKAFA